LQRRIFSICKDNNGENIFEGKIAKEINKMLLLIFIYSSINQLSFKKNKNIFN